MTVKDATHKVLERIDVGRELPAVDIKRSVQDYLLYRENRYVQPFVGTILRYLREYKVDGMRAFVNSNKRKSYYRRIR